MQMKKLIEPVTGDRGRVIGLYIKPGISVEQIKKRLYEFEEAGAPPIAIKRLKTEGK